MFYRCCQRNTIVDKSIWFIVVFFNLIIICNANNDNYLTLQKKLDQTHNLAARINILNSLSENFQRINPNLAHQYAAEAYYNSKKTADFDGMAKSLINIGTIELNSGNNQNAYTYFIKAAKLFSITENQSGIAQAYHSIGLLYYLKGNYNLSHTFYQKSLAIKKLIHDKKGISNTYNNIALNYAEQGFYDSALSFHAQSLWLRYQINDQKLIANSLNNIGNIYNNKKNYNKALEFYYKSLKIQKKLNEKFQIAGIYNNIGSIYFTMNDLHNAKRYYKHFFDLSRQMGNKRQMTTSLNNLGLVYFHNKETDSALAFFNASYKISNEIDDPDGKALALNNIGDVYASQQLHTKALSYFTNSLRISISMSDNNNAAHTAIKIAELKIKSNDYVNALQYISIAEKYGNVIHSSEIKKDIFYYKSKIYAQLGNMKKAVETQKIYANLADSLFIASNINNLAEIQQKYESENKNKEIQILQKEREKQKIKLEQKNKEIRTNEIILWVFISGLLIIALFLFFSIRAYRHIVEANKLLNLQNCEIAEQKEEIMAQTELLESSNKELEKLSVVASKTDNAVLIADNHGNIEWVNDSFVKIYGLTYEDFVSTYGNNLNNLSLNTNTKEQVNKAIEEKSPIRYASRISKNNGDYVWLQTVLTPILDKNGNLFKIIAVETDITAIKQAEQEIIIQNEEIAIQRDNLKMLIRELEKQKEEITKQRDEIAEKTKYITDSISYAKIIQEAILVPQEALKLMFPDSFIFYKPKDIVSGDFFWLEEKESKIFFAAVDCTGHGVPGAFMSIIGNLLLNQALHEHNILEPAEILNFLNRGINQILRKEQKNYLLRDGMDIALCAFHLESRVLEFAGAFNPLYIIHENQFLKYKGDGLPIGIRFNSEFSNYTNHIIQLQPDDCIFIFTDGYIDQFSSDSKKKFSSTKFITALQELKAIPMEAIGKQLEIIFKEWKGEYEQMDDVLVAGIRIK